MGGRVGWTEKKALISEIASWRFAGGSKDRAIASLRRGPRRAFDAGFAFEMERFVCRERVGA